MLIDHPSEQPTIHQPFAQSSEQLREQHNEMQIDHPTEQPTIHQPFALLPFLQQQSPPLLPEAAEQATDKFLVLHSPPPPIQQQSPTLLLESAGNMTGQIKDQNSMQQQQQQLAIEVSQSPNHAETLSHQQLLLSLLVQLPVLAAPQFKDDDSYGTSSIPSTGTSTFMHELDTNITEAAETQDKLSQVAEASELKLDNDTVVSLTIAASVCAQALFEQSIHALSPKSQSLSAPLYSSNDKDDHWLEDGAKHSNQRSASEATPCNLSSKRKACAINLDGNEHLQSISIRTSLRKYDNLMSRKARSDPENKGKEKYSRVLYNEVVKKLFVDD